MRKTHIAYIELRANDCAQAKAFYGSLFGWSFQDWGPDYASFSDAGIEGGINGGGDHRPSAPLVILETNNLEAMAEQVVQAGGSITLPIFTFPGGRRFHFAHPSGHELAMMQLDPPARP